MAKRGTTKDITRLAGVFSTPASFVLNDVAGMRTLDETRQCALEIARQLNYHPHAAAHSMVFGRTNVTGFVVWQSADQAFADLFLPQVLSGLTQASSILGYRTLSEPIPLIAGEQRGKNENSLLEPSLVVGQSCGARTVERTD